MYSETDIEAAVEAGVLPADVAAAFRAHVAASRATPSADEESFRLLTGFNDIFVSIAAVLLLAAVGWIGYSLSPVRPLAVGGASVALASWGLAEYFTRRRRMALPSIILLATYVLGVAWALIDGAPAMAGQSDDRARSALLAAVGLATAVAAYAHWRRFHVPITIAALTGALVAAALALLLTAVPQAMEGLVWLLLAAGIGVFVFAMRWDMSDPTRTTRRSDVAFWLHLAAAPMIAHPIFSLLGVMSDEPTPAKALVVILLYIGFGLIALAVDRRALLVSSLVYVLIALAGLFRHFGAVSLNMALTALVIGSALLLLSAFWPTARRLVSERLPKTLRARLPALDRPAA